jgi:xanthine/uracil/vitamin C permease (AzgA family)
MTGSMLILTWVGIIFVKILHLAIARCKIMINIMPTHVKISIEAGIRELFLKYIFVRSVIKVSYCLKKLSVYI